MDTKPKYTGPERRTTPRGQGTFNRVLDVTYEAIRRTEAEAAQKQELPKAA